MNTITAESATSKHHHQHYHHNHHHQRHGTSAPFSDTTFHYGGTTEFLNYTFDDVADDVDNFNYINKHFITPALFYSITLVGITGNSLVIYVILSNQKMRTVINLLLFNLAIADLSFVAVVPPSTSYYLAMEHWPFGNVACKTMHYLVNVTAYITVYTLVLISVIRFLTVVRGLNTTAWRTKRIVMASVVGMWLLMLLLNMPIFFKYHVRTTEQGIMECDYDDEEAGKGIFTTFFVFAYLLPLACIGMLSVGILRHIEKNKPTCGPMLANHRKTRSGIKKRQASRLLILVVVMFAVSWLPIQFHLLLGAHFGVPDSNLYAIIHCLFCLLAYSNSCVNPIIYNHTSRDFREAFRAAVARCCHCCLPLRKPCAKDNTTFSMAETIPTMSKRRDIKMSKIGNGDEDKKVVGGGGGLSMLVETVGEVMAKNDDIGDGDGPIVGGDFGDVEGVEYNPGGNIEMKIEAECNNIQRVSDDNDGDDVIAASVVNVNVE